MTIGPGNIPVGSSESFYVMKESSFKTFTKPTATSAIRVKSTSFTPEQERVNRDDKRGTRSRSERITRKKTAEWSFTAYLNPSGSAGVAPEISDMMESVMGTKVEVAGTSVTYSLAEEINDSYTLHRRFGGYAESLVGAVPNQMVLRVQGEEECEVEFSGAAADFISTAPTTISATASAGSTTVTIDDASDFLSIDSVIQVGTNNNSSEGFRVTNIVGTTVTLESALDASAASGAPVSSFFPAPITLGSPLGCFPGTVTFSGQTGYVTEFEITVNNNISMQNDTFGSETATGFFATARREVDFTGGAYAQAEHAALRGKSEKFDQTAIVITIGTTAGRIVTITMSNAEFNIIPYEVPEEDQVTISLEGMALATGVGSNEITVAFT